MLRKIITSLSLIVLLLNPLIINAAKIDEYKDKQEEAENKLENDQENRSAIMKEIKSLSDSISDNEDKLSKVNAQLV